MALKKIVFMGKPLLTTDKDSVLNRLGGPFVVLASFDVHLKNLCLFVIFVATLRYLFPVYSGTEAIEDDAGEES